MAGLFSQLSNWWTRHSDYESDSPLDGLNRFNEDRYFYTLNSSPFHRYGLCSIEEIRLGFTLCPPLAAIVSQKANAFSKGKIIVWNPENEKPVRGEFKEWERLFRNPNPLQTQRQFIMQGYSYAQMFAYCVIEPTYGTGFEDRPVRLDVLHNWAIEWGSEIDPVTLRPKQAWYNFMNNGRRRELNVAKLIIVRDSSSTDIDETTGLPISRASVLEQEVSNVIAALNAKGQMVTDRGANGIISNNTQDKVGHVSMHPDEKDLVQQQARRYGNMKNQDKLIITNANLSYTPMTFDYEKLGLSPITVDAIKSICNRYSFPFTALAEGFEGKYNNSTNGRRDFQDTTIDPESIDFFEQLSLGLKMYDQKCEAYMDYSHVASVQASQEERGKGEDAMATALTKEWDLGIITRNDVRDKLGYEKIKGKEDEFDKFKFETASAIQQQQLENNSTFGNNNVDNGSVTQEEE